MLDVSLFASAKCSGRCAQNPKQSGVETFNTPLPHAALHGLHLQEDKAIAIASTCGVVNEGLQTWYRQLPSRRTEMRCWGCFTLLLLIVGMIMCLKASGTPCPCCNRPSASWLDGLAGARHCTNCTSALELPGWRRAKAEQAHGLSLLVHVWSRNCP